MIRSVAKVIVPVDDQERAVEFWTERPGFAVADPDGTRYALGQW